MSGYFFGRQPDSWSGRNVLDVKKAGTSCMVFAGLEGTIGTAKA
jgi:hypothetical protein